MTSGLIFWNSGVSDFVYNLHYLSNIKQTNILCAAPSRYSYVL